MSGSSFLQGLGIFGLYFAIQGHGDDHGNKLKWKHRRMMKLFFLLSASLESGRANLWKAGKVV